MYSGRFCPISTAARYTGLSIMELIDKGLKGEISIYAWEDWFHFDSEAGKPFSMHSVDSPILMNDDKVLVLLKKGKSATFIVDIDGRFICNRGATDDYLDGVEVTQADLFCLKSEIEEMQARSDLSRQEYSTDTANDKGIEISQSQNEFTKLDKQQQAILEIIKKKRFDPMKIPDGEKGTIQKICEADDSGLFKSSSAFERAWKKGIGHFWKMEFHDSYARRGKN